MSRFIETEAFLNFCDFMQEQLRESGITVIRESHTTEAPPYLVMQSGPINQHGWVSKQLCQAWVVVAKDDDMEAILKIVRQTSTRQKHVKVFEVTQEMSNDSSLNKRVITWTLHNNIQA